MALLWFAGNGYWQRRIISRDRVADSKEITQWHKYARMCLIIPEYFKKYAAIIEWVYLLPIHTQRVVDFKNRRDITTQNWIDQTGTY
jgi:hypothetical protein